MLLEYYLIFFQVIENDLVIEIVDDDAVGITGELDTSHVIDFEEKLILDIVIDLVAFVIILAHGEDRHVF